ncbi:tyrosine-type recombinase/integrase [Commensalibacter communis]|uniref:tyrosine-type recombinase/integrase n=1 Tax=Commensalibacter communis TaxID=2972786 RepID=UPI0022FF83A8|nr:site-specific integrase [Commensalibacter communis]CAI3961336.1 Integrase/recombinase [Commensalibacter communis]
MPRLLINRLSEKKINQLTNGTHSDGRNLYLNIRGNSKIWVFRFKSPITGKIRMQGLGPFPIISLSKARNLANKNKEMLINQLDPLEEKRNQKLAIQKKNKLFNEVAKEYTKNRSKQWRSKKTQQETESLLRNYINSNFEGRLICSITSNEILTLLKPVWYKHTTTGVKLQGLLNRIFQYATAYGWFEGNNPAKWDGFLENLLPKPSLITQVTHYKAYDWKQINKLYNRLRSINTIPNLAICFICLTACRSAEAREMQVKEINFTDKLWTLPASRSKTKKCHRIPLSDEALIIIKCALKLNNNEGDYVFQHNKKPIYDKALLFAVKKAANDNKMTLHGFRSSFRDWGSEATNIQSEILEMALGHSIKSKVEAAYRRGDMLDKRRQLMNKWAEYCTN